MKTITMAKLLSILTLFMSLSVHAQISQDLKNDVPPYLRDARVETSGNKEIRVIGAAIKSDLYAKPVFLEVEIADYSYEKEIYIVNLSNENQRNNRRTKAVFISNTNESNTWMFHGGDSSGNAEILYVGRGENNSSRFIILSPGLVEHTAINMYVKMNAVQYETQIYIR